MRLSGTMSDLAFTMNSFQPDNFFFLFFYFNGQILDGVFFLFASFFSFFENAYRHAGQILCVFDYDTYRRTGITWTFIIGVVFYVTTCLFVFLREQVHH